MTGEESRWYVGGPGKKPYGPYSLGRLRDYVQAGKVKPDSSVLKEGAQEWIPASSIPELFSRGWTADPPPATAATPPAKLGWSVIDSCFSGVIYAIFGGAMLLCAVGLFLYGLFQLVAGSTVVVARDSQLLGIAVMTLMMTVLQLIVLVQAANTLRRIEKQRR